MENLPKTLLAGLVVLSVTICPARQANATWYMVSFDCVRLEAFSTVYKVAAGIAVGGPGEKESHTPDELMVQMKSLGGVTILDITKEVTSKMRTTPPGPDELRVLEFPLERCRCWAATSPCVGK